jgi:ADP-ribose pyrophosphatase YjhB (NUDIX family)
MQSDIKHFNIRVYALIFNDMGEILLSDEYILDRKMTKFPGGGLQFGEGPAECIHREALEEFGQEIEIIEHFYTTDFFQKASFFEDQQLISIYYIVKFKEMPLFRISSLPYDFPEFVNGSQSFRWVDPALLQEEQLSFPIDRYVLDLIKTRFHKN